MTLIGIWQCWSIVSHWTCTTSSTISAHMLLTDLILRAVCGIPHNSLIHLLVLHLHVRSLNLIFLETITRMQGCNLRLPLQICQTGIHHFHFVESKVMNLGPIMVQNSWKMHLSLVQIRDPQVKDTRHGLKRSPRLRVWMVVKDADRPVPETWFGLVLKALGSGGTLPSSNVVTLPFGTLIHILAATRMSMMTETSTGQVLHCKMHPEMLLMQV